LTQAFDAVYGASAGAFAGTFFVTNRMVQGPAIFYDDLTTSRFISLPRLLGSRPMMNLGFLLDTILDHAKPMDWRGVIDSPIPLKIVVASLNHRRSLCIDDYATKDDLFTLLRASSTIPIVAGPPVRRGDDELVDACLYESIPVRAALADGCTGVLVLLSRPRGCINRIGWIERRFVVSGLDAIRPGLARDYVDQVAAYNEELVWLYSLTDRRSTSPNVCAIAPAPEAAEVSAIEKNRSRLIAGAMTGRQAIFRAFSPPPTTGLTPSSGSPEESP
jgi:predicted patatin/cPLA2 family phospholipase